MTLVEFKRDIEERVRDCELDLAVIPAVMNLHFEGIFDAYRQDELTEEDLMSELDRLSDDTWVTSLAVEYYNFYEDTEFDCGPVVMTGKEIADFFLENQ